MAAEHVERIGKRIRQRRLELKRDKGDEYTQDGVARQIGGKTTGTAVSRWERALHQPSGKNLEDLARVLEVDVAYFYAAPVDDEPERGGETPDLGAIFNGKELDLQAQLAAMQGQLARLQEAVDAIRDVILQDVLPLLDDPPDTNEQVG
jgi:transcriptional regulator with XRE-family HTH domain